MLMFFWIFRDATCGGNWQVVVGEDYGACVRTQSDKVAFFKIDNSIFIYVFKSDLIGGGISEQTELSIEKVFGTKMNKY